MSCERYEEAWIDVAAGEPPSAALRAHLEACPECRSLVAEQRRMLEEVDGALRARLAARPSSALAARVASQVRETDHRGWRPLWAAAMAAAVGVAALAGWLARRPAGEVPGGMSQAVAVPRATARPDAARAAAGVRVAAGAPPRVAARPTAEPLVLVPPGQEEALRRFVVSLRDGALPTPPLLIAGTSVEGAVETPPLPDVPAVFVEPLSDAGVVSERSQR